MKKSPVNLNPNSAFDIALAKMSAKERGKAMASGEMPDDWDYENISNELKKFEAQNPGLIARMAEGVYKEIEASDITKEGILHKQLDFQKGFWLPAGMMTWMETAYPTFWANKKHTRWFMRKFPIFSYETYTRRIKVK